MTTRDPGGVNYIDPGERPFDAGSVTSVRTARKEAKRAEIVREDAMRRMLADEASRALIWSYLQECGIFAQTYHPESGAMYFTAGQRNAGLRLWSQIPEDIKAQMAAEHKES